MPSAGPSPLRVEVRDVMAPAERDAVAELAAAALEADGYPALDDETWLAVETAAPGTVSFLAQVPAAQNTSAPAAGLAGVAVLGGRYEPRTLEIAVHPDHRGQHEAVAVSLLDAALDTVHRRHLGAVRLWLRAADGPADAMVAARGFAAERDLLQLRVPLPLGEDGRPPVSVRPFRPGLDEVEWLEVNNRSFADHPEQSGWTLDDVRQREAEPWFDPQGFLLHDVDGRLAAFCWTKVHPAPPVGEIYVIGVDPTFQGRGLGRALTVAGLTHLASVGVRTGMLYVEATNVAALELYRSLGFTLHHRDRAYVLEADRDSPQVPVAPTARPIP